MNTEQDIKQSTIGFLKQYYKFRPRLMDSDNPLYDLNQAQTSAQLAENQQIHGTIARMDMMTDSGIMADGFIQFQTEQGNTFTATFEATALESDAEVRFRLYRARLFWDALASAALLTAFALCLVFITKKDWLWSLNGGLLFTYILLIFLIINILHRKLLTTLPRYRRIFAIEQFKQYFADEQWISISHDLFENPEDEYMLELKKQCVKNGFGLIIVDKDLDPQLYITPAREVILKNRKSFTFFNRLTGSPVAQKVKSWQDRTSAKLRLREELETYLQRFQTPFYLQMIVTGLASIIVIAIFFNHIYDTPKQYVDERYTAEENMLKWRKENRKEKNTDEWKNVPKDAREINNAKDQKNWTDIAANEPMPANVEDEFSQKGIGQDGLYLTAEDGKIQYLECSRLDLETANIVIKESQHPNLISAQRRINFLKKSGIQANCIWLGCFSRSTLEYVVFLDLIFKDKKQAILKSQEFYKRLKTNGLDTREMEVLQLN